MSETTTNVLIVGRAAVTFASGWVGSVALGNYSRFHESWGALIAAIVLAMLLTASFVSAVGELAGFVARYGRRVPSC